MSDAKTKQLVFGPVVIEWDAIWKFPIAVDHEKHGWFVTQCEITYRYGDGDYFLKIRSDYSFDGASIPWLVRIVPGFAKLDWHLLAALPHDYVIDNPSKLPRSVADGIFVSVLIALAENRQETPDVLAKIQGYLMFFAVWTWTIITCIRHPPNNVSKPPMVANTPEVAATPATIQAEAVADATVAMKVETATPPEPAPAAKSN